MKQIVLLCVLISSLSADIFTQNSRLNRTLNLGNYFEAPTEGSWNVVLEDKDLETIANKGFTAIRLPVRWSSRLDSDTVIDPAFLTRISGVVKKANDLGMTVIMDDHHFDSLFANFEANRSTSLSIWKQLSTHFASVPDSLLFFEPLNEPHDQVTSDRWNTLFADHVEIIRQTNPTRPIVMGTTEWGGINGLYSLVVPEDKNIIVTVHYYGPFEFTHQGASWVTGADAWIGTTWTGTTTEKKTIISDIEAIVDWSVENNRPVFVGEFGSYEKAPIEYRLLWTHFIARLFESRKISWAYWEYSSGFGLYDKKNESWKSLVDTLLSNDTSTLKIIEPELVLGKELIVNGDFSLEKSSWISGAWNSQASAQFDYTQKQLNVTVGSVTESPYNIQLLQSGISLEASKEYYLAFDISTPDSFSLSANLMRKDYTSIASGPTKRIVNKTTTYTATISVPNNETDLTFAINLGYKVGSIIIDNISLREIVSSTSIIKPEKRSKLITLTVKNNSISFSEPIPEESELTFYSIRGQEVGTVSVSGKSMKLPKLAKGWYGVILKQNGSIIADNAFIQE